MAAKSLTDFLESKDNVNGISGSNELIISDKTYAELNRIATASRTELVFYAVGEIIKHPIKVSKFLYQYYLKR